MKPENLPPDQIPTDAGKPQNNSAVPGSIVAPDGLADRFPSDLPMTTSNSHSTSQLPASIAQAPQPLLNSQIPPVGTKPPRNWKKFALIPAAVLILSVVGGVSWFVFLRPDDPDTVFRKSLESALSTKSVQIDMKLEDSGYSFASVTKMDTSNIKQPKTSSTTTEEYDQGKSTVEVYTAPNNAYFKVSGSDLLALQGIESLKGKWVHAIKGGGSPLDGGFYQGLTLSGQSWAFFGYLVHGNFESDQREEFINFLLENEVYEYTSEKVKKRNIDGKRQLVYDVDVNESGLREFNKMVAKSAGVNENEVDNAFSLISTDIKIKFYIDPGQKRITKLELDDAGLITKILISGFNKTTVPAAPKTEVSFEEYSKLAGQLSNDPDNSLGTADDIERKTDINALHGQVEAYYAQNGFYPTLSNLNDPSWRAQNLAGLDDEALKDPKGTSKTMAGSPKPGSYSYSVEPANCDNGSNGDCYTYILTATLDEGGTYVKEALN